MRNRGRRHGGARWQKVVALATCITMASVGGYLFSAAVAWFLARALPMGRLEAATTASMLAILAMPAVAIWAFAVSGAWRALCGIAGGALALGGIGWLLGPRP